MTDAFVHVSRQIAGLLGSPWAFLVALATIMAWVASGPVFGFSSTWQLVINTGTTIVTFLMVFIIQNTQNRDGKAIHLKLDELLRATHGARDEIIDVEDMSEDQLQELASEFRALAERYGGALDRRAHSDA